MEIWIRIFDVSIKARNFWNAEIRNRDFIQAASPNFQPSLILLCTNEEMGGMRNV